MAKRTVALYKDKYIGIETIYTVINGKQINIPEKLRELRDKSHNDELFCPCGCGMNLVLVAGDKNLREQHFRAKIGTGESECSVPTESETSIDSKIVLKCWLDDKLNSKDIESRVPIEEIGGTSRKIEFTFFSKSNRLAIRYWRTRSNILEDNLDVSLLAKDYFKVDQMEEIRLGLKDNLDVSVYAKENYSSKQMKTIRKLLKKDIVF